MGKLWRTEAHHRAHWHVSFAKYGLRQVLSKLATRVTTAWGLSVASKAVLGRLLIDAHLRVSSPQTIMSAGPSRASTFSSHPNFLPIFDAALESYKNKTKQDLVSHPLLPILQSCDSPEAILTVLRGQIPAFDQPQNGDDGLTKWVTPTVNVLYSVSATLGAGVGLVSTRTILREVCAQYSFFRHSLQQTQYLRALVFSSRSVVLLPSSFLVQPILTRMALRRLKILALATTSWLTSLTGLNASSAGLRFTLGSHRLRL